MADTTEIEKKSLEAHVELCAERYRFLEQKLEHMDEKIDGQSSIIREVHDMVAKINEKRTDQIIGWGLGIMGLLVATIGYLITNFVIK
jgi:hypothetical protein